jgi:hypothetical protein
MRREVRFSLKRYPPTYHYLSAANKAKTLSVNGLTGSWQLVDRDCWDCYT